MPIKMLNFIQAPPPISRKGGKVQQSEEWKDMVLALGAGLKPQEYIMIEIPDDHEMFKKMKAPRQAFLAAAKLKIKKLGLPYDATMRADVIYIVGRGVLS